MTTRYQPSVNLSNLPLKNVPRTVDGEYVTLFDETYYRIRNYDSLEPFFITLVSSSNHWVFVSSTGGLTAGRVNADHALFPYYTVDKITENSENTGPKTLIMVTTNAGRLYWEPFSLHYDRIYQVERNLYKNVPGTTLMFEEINYDLELVFRYTWRTSETYGFVKTSYLVNHTDRLCRVEVVDGLQNILPAHVTRDAQNHMSNLLDAYKFNELHTPTGLGLFSLSSRLTDLAEPSESLRANTIWHTGLDNIKYLLSSSQLDTFRGGLSIGQEDQVRGKRGAYFVNAQFSLAPNVTCKWYMVAEVDQDSSDVVGLINFLSDTTDNLVEALEYDIKLSQQHLQSIVGMADGLQLSADQLSTTHHYANVLFNVMRGGIFADHYSIDVSDLRRFIATHNRTVLNLHVEFFESLPTKLDLSELYDRINATNETDLIRLVHSYLPLTFSRRHGDPSRPWNRFEIKVKQANGSQKLDYQGNWRDIFQNWEALSYSYPQYIDAMINAFLNATTVDGYNPYRITRDGIEWETPDPENAWANIGYWNDHQVIYLQKLLEVSERFYPQKLQSLLQRRIFSSADVPYRINAYKDLIRNAYDTIEYDWDQGKAINKRVKEIGADGKLVHDAEGRIFYASLAEKLLSLLLAKLVNFIPEGGIWLNTQRPEWNDANNALVGKGMSVVTLSYLRRYIVFFRTLLENSRIAVLTISRDLFSLWQTINDILQENRALLTGSISDQERRRIMDSLGFAGSEYRWQYYQNGVSNESVELSVADLLTFLALAQQYLEHSLHANKRDDNLYHAYNILHLSDNSAKVSHLSVMLEGQVAILSSGLLTAEESLKLLRAMYLSELYHADQHSYMLYPNRDVPGFLEKNIIQAPSIQDLELISLMHEHGDMRLLTVDANGTYHFHGDIRNVNDVEQVLTVLAQESTYSDIAPAESESICRLFEQAFNHAAFTGRSSTFFAYEGLGSIYWHMVSKLLLAVQETILNVATSDVSNVTLQALIDVYFDVRAGIGFNKSPAVYGAFPTDPYSHTPLGHGAKQPGMTGMVKEEILTRLVELGILIEDGTIVFRTTLFRKQELLSEPSYLHYVDIHGKRNRVAVPAGSLAFTLCQVPIVIKQGTETHFEVEYTDETIEITSGHRLETSVSQHIFSRSGMVRRVTISFNYDN